MVLLAACRLGGEPLTDADYAAWAEVDIDGSWTLAAESAVRSTSLNNQLPVDIDQYCPQYLFLDSATRTRFWAGLLSVMAKFESDLDPQTEFNENLRDSAGNHVVSRGLLQLSIESAHQDRYGCAIPSERELHDPVVNISCAARILSTWVEADGVVANGRGRRASGGARYWSVLRSSNENFPKIGVLTRRFSFCGAQSINQP